MSFIEVARGRYSFVLDALRQLTIDERHDSLIVAHATADPADRSRLAESVDREAAGRRRNEQQQRRLPEPLAEKLNIPA